MPKRHIPAVAPPATRFSRAAAIRFAAGTILSTSMSRRAGAQTPAKVRVLGPPVDGYKSVFYGVRSGLFARNGLDVDTLIATSGSAAIAAVVGGSADVAYVNVLSVVQAHDKGVPLKLISPAGWYESDKATNLLLVLNSGPIHTAADLNGQTIATFSLGDILAVAIRAWVDQHGGDSKTVKFVEAPVSSMLALLEAGRIGAALTVDPAGSAALATGKARLLGKPLDAIALKFEEAAFAAMEPTVQANPGRFSSFARAMHTAEVYTNVHLAETVDLVASYTGVSPDIVAKSARAESAEYLEARTIQPVIDIAVKYGLVSKAFAAGDIISAIALRP